MALIAKMLPVHKTSMSRRRLFQTAGAAAGMAAFLPLGVRRAAALTPVTFQLSWLHSVPFGGSYIADAKGYWSDLGLDLSLASGGPNAPVEPPVVTGTALMGISAADCTAAAVENDAPFKILAVAMQKNPFAISSLPENPVRSPADLVGKSIGMATTNTPVLKAMCDLNGVNIEAIDIVPT